MREETIKIYTFNELSPEAQKKAIQKYRDETEWGYESQNITENFEIKLEELGLPTDDVEWRLSHCQGDGVAFYGDVDMSKVARRLLEGESLELYKLIEANDLTISANIYRNSFGHHYSHYNTMNIIMDGDNTDTIITYLYESNSEELTVEEWDEKSEKIQSLKSELEELISDDIKTVSRQLETEGYEQISYVESDEYIEESIVNMEYEFTADGLAYRG